jgi:hypothetical protein
MCPLCMTTVAAIAGGSGVTAAATAWLLRRYRRGVLNALRACAALRWKTQSSA